MKRLAIIVTLLGFGLAGCGGSSSSNVAPSTPSNIPTQDRVHVDWIALNNNYYISYWHMPSGKVLTCAEGSGGDTISCNWEAYNKKVGQ